MRIFNQYWRNTILGWTVNDSIMNYSIINYNVKTSFWNKESPYSSLLQLCISWNFTYKLFPCLPCKNVLLNMKHKNKSRRIAVDTHTMIRISHVFIKRIETIVHISGEYLKVKIKIRCLDFSAMLFWQMLYSYGEKNYLCIRWGQGWGVRNRDSWNIYSWTK